MPSAVRKDFNLQEMLQYKLPKQIARQYQQATQTEPQAEDGSKELCPPFLSSSPSTNLVTNSNSDNYSESADNAPVDSTLSAELNKSSHQLNTLTSILMNSLYFVTRDMCLESIPSKYTNMAMHYISSSTDFDSELSESRALEAVEVNLGWSVRGDFIYVDVFWWIVIVAIF